MDFTTRDKTFELLDGDDIPKEDLRRNLFELNLINTFLGGHSISLAGALKLTGGQGHYSIAEIGCGGGDNLLAIAKGMRRKGIGCHLTGIDQKRDCISQAQETLAGYPAKWYVSDYRDVRFEERPDIIFSSLFCHHFSQDELVLQMRWMYENSRLGFFINDLHRHWLAYHSIKLITQVFSKSYLVKNDAPLSVLRSFVKKDWEEIFHQAGIGSPKIEWKWAFRYLITLKK